MNWLMTYEQLSIHDTDWNMYQAQGWDLLPKAIDVGTSCGEHLPEGQDRGKISQTVHEAEEDKTRSEAQSGRPMAGDSRWTCW